MDFILVHAYSFAYYENLPWARGQCQTKKKELDRKKFMENLIKSLVEISSAQMIHAWSRIGWIKRKMENLATYWEVEDQSSSTVDKVFSDGKN